MNTLRKFTAVTMLIGASWPLAAQVTPDATTPETDEEVIVLSPFEVSGTRDTGYQATETLAGTRIRTELKDVASAISVITEQFLQDVGATDSSTLLQYTTNAEVAGTRGTFAGLGNATSVNESDNLLNPSNSQRVRGLDSADNTRDFFGTDIPWDSFNVERIDINRGANSFLFGLGSPAGIVNASTRGAEYSNRGKVEFKVGSYDSVRGLIDLNQVLIDNTLAIRVAGLWDQEKFRQSFTYEDDERVYASVRFDPQLFSDRTWRTSIKLKFEDGRIDANRPRTIPPEDRITPWFRPDAATPAQRDLNSGMGKFSILNGYQIGSAGNTFSPWVGGYANQQQPIWFIDGGSNQLYRIYGGVVNSGALNANGTTRGAADGLLGLRYSDMFSNLSSLSGYATNARLPNYLFGQYRNASLTDPTVFDFYNELIDGPTKNEWEDWKAYNLDFSQTAFDDRLAFQFTYDRQKYERGQQALLGNPVINIDILQNFQDYVTGPNNSANVNVGNPNYGRPFVPAGPGTGNSYKSDRENFRVTLFAELRSRDIFDEESFLAKLLGKHRFNGVYSDDAYITETRSWQMYANSTAYSNFKLQGSFDNFTNLPPVAVVYLGSSLATAPSAEGSNIPGIQSPVTLQDGNIYQFDMTWRNAAGVVYTDPWNVPAGRLQDTRPAGSSLAAPIPIFNGAPVLNPTTGVAYAQLTQVSNPANYVGWNSNFHNSLLRYNYGGNESLVTRAAKGKRETKSYAGSWQGFLWDDAIVATFGWRYDEVNSRSVTAQPQAGAINRGALNLNSTGSAASRPYGLPNDSAPVLSHQYRVLEKSHSTASGVVVHLNRLLGERDPLPINVSLTYNESSNFRITDLRRDIYGNPHPNPTGETKDYSVLIATKDGKYSLRALKYETNSTSSNTQLDNSGIYNTIRDALNWRNIKVYYMSLYDWGSSGQTDLTPYTGRRYLWDPVYVDNTTGRPVAAGVSTAPPANSTLETTAQANTRRDAGIQAINEMQVWLAEKGYFPAWNYGVGPTTQTALQTRGQYEANPILPAPASVYDYRGAPLMQGFAVTADTQSEGYELELTANPLPNWRISFNASKTEAVRFNFGGPVLDELVTYMDALMAGPGGDLVRFNSDYSAGNELRAAWAGWRGQYTLLKLQENSAASELRKWRYNFVTNYTFLDGFLKNVGVGGSYRWQDKVVIGYPVLAGAGGLASFDLESPYYGPSEDSIDLWLSYERKISRKLSWRIQLNIRNAFAEDEVIPISVQPDGQTWASVRIAPAQEWFVTNTFSF
ncbi:MAG TPA: TonB-dependent receptor plug domain-containing protein [Opitutaceae bacterium]|nr:TonB-dependent receptor plug domain-containing protein [Opitutaceae bacterium]